MSTMQKIRAWILILIGVFILSDFLIHVGLNANYKEIERKSSHGQIVVYQAEATYVNGRIRGVLKEKKDEQDTYIKIELYSKRDVLLGKHYIEITNKEEKETQPFSLYFKAKDVAYYTIETVKEKESGTELEVIPREWTKSEILLATAISFLIFWV